MHAPFAQHLTRFSRVPPADVPAVPPPQAPAIAAVVEPTVTMTVAALEARLEEAARRVRAELEAAHAAERLRADAVQAEAMESAVAAASARRDAEEGERFAAQIRSSTDALRTSLCEALANALHPLLSDAVAAKANAELVRTIGLILADPDHPVLTVRGPSARLAAIASAFGEGAALAFAADESSAEISVTANGIRIETRLADAMAVLSGSV